MSASDVVRMANQIASFWAPYPPDDAVAGVLDHLQKFWPPSQRKELVGIASGMVPTDAPLHALALQAALRLTRQVDE